MTKRRALIETDGAGNLLGVWVAEVDRGEPDCAYLDEIDQLMAEKKMADVSLSMDTDDTLTWDGWLDYLEEHQHPLIVRRYAGTTDLGPAELLAAANADPTGANFQALLGIR